MLAQHGGLVPENLDRERISAEEAYGEMRTSGRVGIDQVRWAVLESDGKISFVPETGA